LTTDEDSTAPHDGKTRPEVVYLSEGPPRLELIRSDRGSFTQHSLRVQGGIPGVVAVAGDGDRVLFVRHARPAVGVQLLELPRGFGEAPPAETASDPDASACWNAERELREETGYASRSSRVLGRYVTDSSLLPGEVAVVAIDVDQAKLPGARDGEIDGCVWIPRADLLGLISAGVFADAHTLSALALALGDAPSSTGAWSRKSDRLLGQDGRASGAATATGSSRPAEESSQA
jgi:8-oxo-dGTP pyrophosphatase MutT (NUDIX family)